MLNIGSKTFRNLPEQVAENLKQIGLIWQKLDGLDVYDNVIILEDLSNLNEEQLTIVARPVSFIVYQDVVYVKKGNVGAYALFSPYYSIEADEYITIKSSELKVQFPLGEVTISNLEVELYDKDEIDTLLGNLDDDKADKSDTYTKSEVNSLLLSKVYPVGAIYISDNNTSPASLFGGTWEALNSGNKMPLSTNRKFEVDCGDVHTIKPRSLNICNTYGGTTITNTRGLIMTGDGSASRLDTSSSFYGAQEGNDININNLWATMNNYTEVYMWKRVA